MGSDGTSNTYFTTAAGQAVPTLTGRYGRFRAFLTSTDGLATPELSDVQITHSGTSGWSVTRNTYDPAGNITEVRRQFLVARDRFCNRYVGNAPARPLRSIGACACYELSTAGQ